MAKAKRKRRRPEDWTKLEKEARRDLERNREVIEATSRGVPSQRRSSWRIGKGPGSTKERF